MNNALGDYVFSNPIEQDGDMWSGHIVDRGFKVIKFSTYYQCDLIIYNDADIYDTTIFEGERVHIISFENISKIEGVY